MFVGAEVYATEVISEIDFPGPGEIHVHARPLDTGTVAHVEGRLYTVVWHATGTASSCLLQELALVADVPSLRLEASSC